MSVLLTLRRAWHIMWSVTVMRVKILSRYKGWLAMDILIPIIITLIPILLGRAAGGERAVAAFAENTGTDQYVAYLLIGSNVFTIVTSFLWFVGMWIRRERMTGTLESIYLTAAHRLPILLGTTLYGALRSVFTFTISFTLGCLIFGVNPFQGNILIAIAFLLAGMLPLFGLSLIFGSLIFKIKEAGSLMNLIQWAIMLIMGVYYPITVFPPLMQAVAYAFPPTWMTNGVRASILGVGYFFQEWYFDLAVLGVFMVLFPLLGWRIFDLTDRNMRRNEGVGQF